MKRGLDDAEAMQSAWFKVDESGTLKAFRSASPTGSLATMKVVAQGRFNGEAIAKSADGKLALGDAGERLTTFNQKVTPVKERGVGPVAFSEELKAASKLLHGEQKSYINATWDNLHAEMNLMQSAMRDGLLKKGGTMEIVVAGKQVVCGDCLVQLPIVAEKLGLRYMTVIDKKVGVVYYWRPGVEELSRLGKFSSASSNK